MKNRIKAAWWALLGRPIVANAHLAGGIKVHPDTRKMLIIDTHVSPVV